MKPPVIESLMRHRSKITFLLDSGAFTAWNAGKAVSLDSYQQFLSSTPVDVWRYFALDVIGDPAATMRNYDAMLDAGYNPIPVFTPSQSFDDIAKYYETSDVIGCGGLTTKYGRESISYLTKVFSHAKGRAIHLLGYTKPEYIKHFKPYSCDSSSWNRAQRYGLCDLYVGNGKYLSFTRRQAANKPNAKILHAIKDLGFNLNDFTKEVLWRDTKRNIARVASARSWVKYAIDAERNIGTKIFMACGSADNIDMLVDQLDYWNARIKH